MGKALSTILACCFACGGSASTSGGSPAAAPSAEAKRAPEPEAPSAEPGGPDNPKLVGRIDEFVDEACACTEVACADRVVELLKAFLEDKPPRTERDEKLIEESRELMAECRGDLGVVHADDLAGHIDALANEMCACKDKACLKDVQRRLVQRLKSEPAPDQSEPEKLKRSMRRMKDCILKMDLKP